MAGGGGGWEAVAEVEEGAALKDVPGGGLINFAKKHLKRGRNTIAFVVFDVTSVVVRRALSQFKQKK